MASRSDKALTLFIELSAAILELGWKAFDWCAALQPGAGCRTSGLQHMLTGELPLENKTPIRFSTRN